MSIAPLQIPKGTDLTVNLTLYASDGVTPLNLASYPYMDVYLYQIGSKEILAQYSKATATGYGAITYTNSSAGQISFILTRTTTRKAKADDLFACVRASGGTYYYGIAKVLVGVIVESVGGANEIPT